MEAHPRLGMACSAGAVCGFVAFAFQAAALLSGVR
jgi:hypothetical protein